MYNNQNGVHSDCFVFSDLRSLTKTCASKALHMNKKWPVLNLIVCELCKHQCSMFDIKV